MNKKISTRVGIITAMTILAYLLILRGTNVATNSPLVAIQFLLLFIGLFVSCYLLYKNYTAITFIDALKHCIKTLATVMVLMVAGNALLFFILKTSQQPMSDLTILIGYTIFAYSISGMFSSLFSSFIFNTFTKK
jgi:hypothetical protein